MNGCVAWSPLTICPHSHSAGMPTGGFCCPLTLEPDVPNSCCNTGLDPEKSLLVYKLREGLHAHHSICRDSQQLQEMGFLLKGIKSHRWKRVSSPSNSFPHEGILCMSYHCTALFPLFVGTIQIIFPHISWIQWTNSSPIPCLLG